MLTTTLPDTDHARRAGVVLNSTYDADGNRKSLSAEIGSTPTPDFVNSYQYDSSNREVQVTQVQASGGNYVEGKLAVHL